MALADTYTVSGTGTEYDGVYTPNGDTQHSVPVYQMGTGHYLFIDHLSSYRWAINDTVGDVVLSNVQYYSQSFFSVSPVVNPDERTWSVGDGSGSAPTVTAGTLVTNKTRGAALFF